jgi:hypothetical protein
LSVFTFHNNCNQKMSLSYLSFRRTDVTCSPDKKLVMLKTFPSLFSDTFRHSRTSSTSCQSFQLVKTKLPSPMSVRLSICLSVCLFDYHNNIINVSACVRRNS